ncbi:MAG: DUF2721 domain-containing protein [Nanoarchaeota archaeon]|nr:DUF2721 domain-containing protein [Nanoarchaeota archaeon]
MIDSAVVVKLLQAVLVPILTISGLGIFILVVQMRYSGVISRIRVLNGERLDLIKKSALKETRGTEKKLDDYRLKDIGEQLQTLAKRGKLLKNSLELIFIAVFTFITSSLLLLIEQTTKIPVSLLAIISFGLGLIMLFAAGIILIKEVRSSYNAVMLDIATRVPDEYNIKIPEANDETYDRKKTEAKKKVIKN